MYKKAKYITTIPGSDGKIAYLLCKNPKILIPVELRDSSDFIYPDPCTIFRHVLAALRTEIVSSKIYNFQDNVFYAYVTLKQAGRYIDLNVPPFVALKICKILDVPILVNEKIIKDLGFCVTKEMIEKAINDCPKDY